MFFPAFTIKKRFCLMKHLINMIVLSAVPFDFYLFASPFQNCKRASTAVIESDTIGISQSDEQKLAAHLACSKKTSW